MTTRDRSDDVVRARPTDSFLGRLRLAPDGTPGQSSRRTRFTTRLVLTALVLASGSALQTQGTAAAAGTCAWSISTVTWSADFGWFGSYNVGQQEFRSDSCHNGSKYTTNGPGYHTCNKAGWAIVNSITKDTSYGQSGGNRVVNTATCHFHGGLEIKGVGFGVTRDWNLQHTKHISGGVSYVAKTSWTSCC